MSRFHERTTQQDSLAALNNGMLPTGVSSGATSQLLVPFLWQVLQLLRGSSLLETLNTSPNLSENI